VLLFAMTGKSALLFTAIPNGVTEPENKQLSASAQIPHLFNLPVFAEEQSGS